MEPRRTLNARQRHRQRFVLAVIPWRAVVWVIFAAVFWDAGALIFTGNTSAYSSPSYEVLKSWMPAGGMRSYGYILAALFLVTIYAYGRSTESPNDWLLRAGLAGFAAWYTAWTAAILLAWFSQLHATGIGGLGRTLAFAAISLIASFFAPHGSR